MSGPDASALRAAGAAADEEQSRDPVDGVKKPCPNCWIEVKVVSDRQTPYKQERVWLLDGSASPREKLTDARGVARWEAVPEGPRYRVQLVDVLEAWPDKPKPGGTPKPESFRKQDTTTHDVEPNVPADQQVIVVNQLSEKEKFAYFMWTYMENEAFYTEGFKHTHQFETKDPRWHWSKGAVCNEHINFFLAYWFNYNQLFTYSGGSTCMGALPTFSSENQKIWNATHRGYKEFLTAVEPPDYPYHHKDLDKYLPYIFAQSHFDAKGVPLTDLYDRLGEISVYSIADEKRKPLPRGRALLGISEWLSAHPSHLPAGKSVKALSDEQLWSIAYAVRPGDPDRPALLAAIRSRKVFNKAKGKDVWLDAQIWDHHAGILFKKNDGRLHTFSADSPAEEPIVERTFAGMLPYRKILWMAFWPLKKLRPGGYPPDDAATQTGKVDLDSPSRFIDWSEAK